MSYDDINLTLSFWDWTEILIGPFDSAQDLRERIYEALRDAEYRGL